MAETETLRQCLRQKPIVIAPGVYDPLTALIAEETGFPGGIVRALARTAVDYYASLATHRSTESFRNRMFDFAGLNELLGTPDMLEHGKCYAPDTAPSKRRGA
jgi:hypothetical protein